MAYMDPMGYIYIYIIYIYVPIDDLMSCPAAQTAMSFFDLAQFLFQFCGGSKISHGQCSNEALKTREDLVFFWSYSMPHGTRPAISDKELQDMLGALDVTGAASTISPEIGGRNPRKWNAYCWI
jgi:hypothetical protein